MKISRVLYKKEIPFHKKEFRSINDWVRSWAIFKIFLKKNPFDLVG